MKHQEDIGLDFVVDKLTNSIQNTISGDSFQTEVAVLTAVDIKAISKKRIGFLIGNWNLRIHIEKFLN